MASAPAFFLACSALPLSDAKYLSSALTASIPFKRLNPEFLGCGGDDGGLGAAAAAAGPFPDGGFISCFNGVSGGLGIMLSLALKYDGYSRFVGCSIFIIFVLFKFILSLNNFDVVKEDNKTIFTTIWLRL